MIKNTFLAALLLSAAGTFAQGIGIKLAYIDSAYKPQADFYKFCNGKWLKDTKIPESDSRWGSFNEINEFNLKNIKNILDAVSTSTAAAGTDEQKLRDFYLTALDSAKADKEGINPIKPLLAKIDAAKSINDLVKLSGEFKKYGMASFLNFDIDADLKNSKRNVVYLYQSGYSLPDRDYYFEPQFEAIRTAYEAHLDKMFELLGFYPESAKGYAHVAYKIEKSLAEKAMNAEEQRDVQKLYNPRTKQQMIQMTPGIDWNLYFTSQGMKVPDTITVANLAFYENLSAVVKQYSLNDWKTFMKWKVIHEAAPFLSSAVEKEDFDFFSKTVRGAKQMKPRWKRSYAVVNGTIGEILGKMYVQKYFNEAAKEKVKNMVENLVISYRERLATRTWMSEETKKQANRKLDLLVRKFGFPDTWKDYSTLKIGRESYWKNLLATQEYEYRRKLAKLSKPVDRMEWGMTPPTVNAYYNPATNEIAFPAGIMQIPFFDQNADDAFNYGIMGAIIGHELTHGFDDTGAQFDAEGNLKMWWTEDDYKNFKARTKLIIDQFNGFIAIDSIHVNGALTQGENIADLGGLTMAYYAYKKSLKGQKSPVMNGFTGEQRFFIAWTQGWKELARDAAVKHLVSVDPHAPGKFRGVAPLTNMKEFYEAFNIKPGDPMYRPDNIRVEIW